MNEEDLRMLQEAVGPNVDEALHTESTNVEVDAELLNMPDDELARLIAQLGPALPSQEQMQPAEVQSESEGRGKVDGAGTFDPDLFRVMSGIAELEELVQQSLVQPNADAADHQRSNEPVKKEYNEAELSADLERAIEEMSRPVTRINSPGPEAQSQHIDLLSQPLAHGNRDEFQHNLESVVAALQQQHQHFTHIDEFHQHQSTPPNDAISDGHSQSTSPHASQPQISPSQGVSRRSSSAGRNTQFDDMDDPNKAAERERIREENRERKKRWREVNQDRNKDNDLRCRVTKRAMKLFGQGENQMKMNWINEEFNRRRSKREQKERNRHEAPRRGPAGTYPPSRPNMNGVPSCPQIHDTRSNETRAHEVLELLMSGRHGTPAETMKRLIPYLQSQPGIVEELMRISRNCGHADRVLKFQNSSVASQQVLVPPAAIDQSRCPGQSLLVEATADGTSFDAYGDLPDGFDALIAEVQKQLPQQLEEKDETASEPIIEASTDLAELEMDIDNLLAQFGSANEEPATSSQARLDTVSTLSPSNAVTDDQIATSDVLDSDLPEGMDVDLTVELLEIMAAAGIDMVDLEALVEGEEMVTDNKPQELVDTKDELTATANSDDIDDTDDLDDLTPEQLAELLADLQEPQDETAELDAPPASQTQPSQITAQPLPSPALPAQMEQYKPSLTLERSNSVDSRSSPVHNAQHSDGSSLYDAETIAAILNALMENYPAIPAPNPPTPTYRGTKRRASLDYTGPSHGVKRIRGTTPNGPVPSAVSQLQDYLQTSEDVDLRPYQSSSSSQVTAVYNSSYGNSDATNKRALTLKPPPYRPVPNAASAPIPPPTVSSPPKKKEDEKKIKAMGFPPLMAGMKKVLS